MKAVLVSMTNKTYELIERLPTVGEHKELWESVGWGTVDTEMSAHSLANSVYGVVVVWEGNTVGMGRIVGDGAMYFYIQDVAVLPEHQNSGLGKWIMERLIDFIKKSRHSNGVAFAGLFASEGKDKFYKRLGFNNHAPGMTGMFAVWDK